MSVETQDPTTGTRGIVMTFRPRSTPPPAPVAPIVNDLQVSLQAIAFAREVLAVDQNLLRAPGDITLDGLLPDVADRFLDRASIALHLGDPVRRAIADEKAAIQMLFSIAKAVKAGGISKESPLAVLDLSMCRVAAKFAVCGGLDYLAGREKRR